MKTEFRFYSFILFLLCVFAVNGWSVDYDLKEMTPQIQQALSGRQVRYGELQRLKALGQIGEDRQGYVIARENSPEVSAVAGMENQDRQVIYQAIASQNNLGPAGLRQVEEVFGEVQRGKARPGDWIQLRSGEWVQK